MICRHVECATCKAFHNIVQLKCFFCFLIACNRSIIWLLFSEGSCFFIVLTFSTSTWIQSILAILLYTDTDYLTLLRSMLFQFFPSFQLESFCVILYYCVLSRKKVHCFVDMALPHSKFNVGWALCACVSRIIIFNYFHPLIYERLKYHRENFS